jgi:DNA-binding NtrC family response regulator
MSILIVEDDPDDLVITGRLFHRLGHDVTSASTIEQARAFIVANIGKKGEMPFDLALVDLRLIGSYECGSSIAELCQEIAPKMPVVMFTGWGSMRAFDDLVKLCYVAVAFKPLDESTIVRILDRHKIQWKYRKPNEILAF